MVRFVQYFRDYNKQGAPVRLPAILTKGVTLTKHCTEVDTVVLERK